MDGSFIARITRTNNRLVKSTVNVASGETYGLEFKANDLGNWPFHCHLPASYIQQYADGNARNVDNN